MRRGGAAAPAVQHVQVFGDDVGEMYHYYQIISLKSESSVGSYHFLEGHLKMVGVPEG